MISNSRFRARRIVLWHLQGGLCDCCERPMWERAVEASGEFRLRVFGSHGLGPTRQDLRRLWLCTYEHVVPRSRGGRRPDMLRDVATCCECNGARSSLDYARFRALVRLGNTPAAAARYMRKEAA